MKIIYSFIVALFIFASITDTVLAQTSSPVISKKDSAQTQENRLMKAKEKGNREVTRRITILNRLVILLDNVKGLTGEQRVSLKSQVQAEIDSLTVLKEKINADTDLVTLRVDLQSITKSYRVFALFVPKIQIIIKADRALSLTDSSSSLSAKLAQRISQAQAEGKDVITLQTLLTDMQKQITDAKTQAQNAINTVLPLTPDGYPANKTSLMNARKMLQSSHQNLKDAQINGKKIIKGLRTTPTPTR